MYYVYRINKYQFIPIIKSHDSMKISGTTMSEYRASFDEAIKYESAKFSMLDGSEFSNKFSYAVLGGKYLRGILLLEFAKYAGDRDATKLALSVEYIQSSSLIIDDLPSFDNDDIRRSKPSFHVKYGVANAQLMSASLLIKAMDNIISSKYSNIIGRIVSESINNAISGQKMDIDTNRVHNIHEVIYKKTVVFFMMPVLIGWISSNGSINKLKYVRLVGFYVGFAFQIADDIGDVDTDKSTYNYCTYYGRECAINMLYYCIDMIREYIKKITSDTYIWENEIIPSILAMAK